MAAAGNSRYPIIYRGGNGFEEHAAVEDAAVDGALTIKSYQGYYKLHGPIKSVTSSSVEKVQYIYHYSYCRGITGFSARRGEGGEGGVSYHYFLYPYV